MYKEFLSEFYLNSINQFDRVDLTYAEFHSELSLSVWDIFYVRPLVNSYMTLEETMSYVP